MKLLPTTLAVAIIAAVCLGSARARADTSVIRRPGARPHYAFEAEPHLVLGAFDPVYEDADLGLGLGFRGTVEVAKDGFTRKFNNSVGVGFGVDFVRRGSARSDECIRFDADPGKSDRCVEYDTVDIDDFVLPVVMQWNVWLTRSWSVFAEGGPALLVRSPGKDHFRPLVFYAGGRWHFADAVSLTMRLGWPTVSVGVSFLL